MRIFSATICGLLALGTASSAMADCSPVGTFSLGLGANDGMNDRVQSIADVGSDELFQVCSNSFHDRTRMEVHYWTNGTRQPDKGVAKSSCILVRASKLSVRAILGESVGEDNVSGTYSLCK